MTRINIGQERYVEILDKTFSILWKGFKIVVFKFLEVRMINREDERVFQVMSELR